MVDVVVTGVGMVTPLGRTASETLESWRSGRAARTAPSPDLKGTPLENFPVAVMPAFDPAERLGGRRMIKYMSDQALFGCVAAREAVTQARVKERFRPERIGLFAGSGLATAGVKEVEPMIAHSIDDQGRFSCRELGRRGLSETNPLLSFKILANMPPCLVSLMEGIRGANLIFTPWEGQTAAALIEGRKAVSSGEVDAAVVGAADHATHPATIVYLRQAGLLRESEIPASGAAYLVLEKRETAEKDRQPILSMIESMSLIPTMEPANDPLASRMGRSFAAAPAVLLALRCLGVEISTSLIGADRGEFRFSVAASS